MKLVLLSLVLAVPAFADGKATLEDLQAMARDGSFDELLEHAEDVPAAKRTDEWRSVVTKAATAVVERDESRAATLSARYPFLSKDAAFAKTSGAASVSVLEKCLRDERLKDPLGDCVSAFRRAKPPASTLVAAAKLVRRTWNPAAPLDLWADAVSADKTICSDSALHEAVVAGLELPRDAERAGLARTLAFETCWSALQPVMKAKLVGASSALLANSCTALRAKKALTELQSELCKDEGY